METQYNSKRQRLPPDTTYANTNIEYPQAHVYNPPSFPALQAPAHPTAQYPAHPAPTAQDLRDVAASARERAIRKGLTSPTEPSAILREQRRRPAPLSVSRDPVRDFHAGPPPLRRLSAPSIPLAEIAASGIASGSNHSTKQHRPTSPSSARSQQAFLPLPSLAPRAHAPPPAISIPPIDTRRTYQAPQSAPLTAPAHFRHLQPPRSAGSPSSAPYLPSLSQSTTCARHDSVTRLAPPYGFSTSHSSSSPNTLDDRSLRSPHPPLTAVYSRQPWPPLPPTLEGDEYSRPFLSSPLADAPPSAGLHPPPNYYPRAHDYGSHLHLHGVHSAQQASVPPPPAYLSAPAHYATPRSHTDSLAAPAHRNSPLYIPPPLRFKYSASPPPHPWSEMPPRKKAGASSTTITSTPATVSSTRSSRRLANSALPVPAKGNGWTTEHTYDSVGQPKEIIVIQDSSSPAPKKRTRAAVAAANAEAQWSATANGLTNGSAAKKRKVEEEAVAKKAKPKAVAPPPPPPAAGAATHPAWDDPEGHYIVKPDDIIGGRYKIVKLLGQGTFGKVVEARHVETRQKVAIKVIRAVQKYRDASKIEIRVLETLKKNDPANTHKCIHLREYFDFRNHPCLVSELYGMSVFDFLKQNGFQPFPEKHIQDFAKSLLQSVKFLHRLKLVHTDLKPENILLVSNESQLYGPRRANARSKNILRNTDIRLIDFGSATFENEYHSSVVSTRHYRAPEIILGLSWSYPCDMFSIGCILVEFFTGDALFQTHDNLEHLAMMEVVMGKMPARMIERGRVKKPEFFKGNKIDFPNPTVSKSSRKFVKGLKALREIIPPNTPTNQLFLDLVVRLLDFDPETRITVEDALKHKYLSHHIPDPPI